jgi:hypothetical protein
LGSAVESAGAAAQEIAAQRLQQLQSAFATQALTVMAALSVIDPVGLEVDAAEQSGELELVANPVPAEFARVIPAGTGASMLNVPEASEAFVTDASAIRGMNASQVQSALRIEPSPTGYEKIEFSSSGITGIASPIRRSNFGFVGGGRTGGGFPEFVIPNMKVPADATRTIIKP